MSIEYTTLAHDPHDLRRPLEASTIVAMCERAFGHDARGVSARELDGGEHNTTYLIRMESGENAILRIAPPPDARLSWDETDLMRKEQAIAPYFASVARLLPRTLMADFTHQLVDRDYTFQTYMPGELWSDVEDDLTPEANESLWRQFARIARAIHGVEGEAFGFPHPGQCFPSWSATVLYMLEQTVRAVADAGLDAVDLQAVLHAARDNTDMLDEIARPRLAHGDMWPFNMLIVRGPVAPAISAVIDADRAWWCDPLADWTEHLFRIKTSPRMQRNHAIYDDEYGPREGSVHAPFREMIYDGMHSGAILAWAGRHKKGNIAAEATDRLRQVVSRLWDEEAR